MEKDPSEGPQHMTGVLGIGPSSKSLDVTYPLPKSNFSGPLSDSNP
jgi:hypothetical protein